MVLETTWHTPTGWLVVHDLLVIRPGPTPVDRRPGYRRAPADFAATGVLLRTATCIGGKVEVMVNCFPLFNYGTTGGTWSYDDDDYVSMTGRPDRGDLPLDLARGTSGSGRSAARCYGRTTLDEGESAFITLSWGAGTVPGSREEAADDMHATVGYWRDWLGTAKCPTIRGGPTSSAAR